MWKGIDIHYSDVGCFLKNAEQVVVVPDDSVAKDLIKCPDGEASCNASGHE